MSIEEIRVLPPLAISRLGAASPMDNYDAVVDPARPLAGRTLRPATTLEVDSASGEIARAFVPEALRFSEDGAARPVAPFLELWADTGAGLEPLTAELLASAGATVADVRWSVHVANHKVFRRTGIADDRADCRLAEFSDHARHALEATCPNFWPGRTLPLGHVQYIKPTAAFPELRLRFTPAAGRVYGSSTTAPGDGPPEDPNLSAVLYDASRGTWMGYYDTNGPDETIPNSIYANRIKGNYAISLGYLDDECDGIISVAVTVGGRELTSHAHVGAGPPAYAPDSFPVRTVADELEQALLGIEVSDEEATLEVVEELLRRAVQTVHLMNTAVMNGNTIDGRTAIASTMISQDTVDTGRLYEPIMAPSLVDTATLENLHQNILAALRSGTGAWFADVLRDYDEIGDLSEKGRRKMPALMRGADGRYMALTRRHLNLVRAVARRPILPGPVMTIDPKNLTAQLMHRASGNPPSTLPDQAISNCFPGLEFDFRNIWRRMFVGLEMHEADNYVLSGEGHLARLAGHRLLLVGGCPTVVKLSGPQRPGKEAAPLTTGTNPDGVWTMEWSNSLATVLDSHVGREVECHFTSEQSTNPVGIPSDRSELEAVKLMTRPLFATGAALDPDRVQPGALTQSLCSPWQNDYRECACYYWAASRPDYVNVDVGADGVSVGNSWLAKDRDPKGYILDDRSDSRLVSYVELFQDWQGRLRFVVEGRDHE